MFLKELASLPGPSGFEDSVRDFIRKNVTADEIYTDILGNLICHKKGNGKKVMVTAHMDEVGFIITEITDGGYLKFATLGSIDSAMLCSQKVLIGKNSVPGIIGIKAIHLQKPDEVMSPAKLKDLYIDIGAENKEDAEKLVNLGDFAVFAGEYTEFGNNLIKSKALDDRVGCAVLMELLKDDFESDIYYVFAVQEEIGHRGAIIATHSINPDISLVLEGTTCADVYGSKSHNQVTNLGNGVAMTSMDNTIISDKEYSDFIVRMANENNIKLQLKRTTRGGTDSGVIQRSGAGVKTAVLAAPCRYLHSPVSVMHADDLLSMYNLSKAILKNIERSSL